MKLVILTFTFCSLLLGNHLHAAQVARQQKQASKLELQMINEAFDGTLNKDRLDDYLKQGADINAQDKYGNTALMGAAKYGHAFMRAAMHGHVDIVQALIAAEADVNVQNNNDNTTLILATWNNSPAIVETLIAAGADKDIINEKNNNKKARDYAWDTTAYDKAVAAGEKERAEYLARKKATTTIVSEQTPLIPDLAQIVSEYAVDLFPPEAQ